MSKQSTFFYAKKSSMIYDDTIELVCPYYRVAHQMLLDLINVYFNSIPLYKNIDNGTKWILDIGAGSGTESIGIMKSFPFVNVVCVDLMNDMKKVYLKNFIRTFGKDKLKDRYIYIHDDFLKTSFLNKLENISKEFNFESGFPIIVSAYTIHHYNLNIKKKFYKLIFKLLAKGGIFINIDLFNHESKTMTNIAHNFDINWIINQFKSPSREFSKSQQINIIERIDLSKKWVKHYQRDNILDPISTQVNLLKNIGFGEVANPFIYYQNGLIWAKK